MFATLLKYEFRRTKNILLPLNLGGLGIGAIGYFLMLIIMNVTMKSDSEQPIVASLLLLLWMGLWIMLILLPVAMTIILCLQFFREKFTDQGYLTFTLPATTHQILLSSYLNFLIWTVVNTIITFAAAGMMFAPLISYFIEELSAVGLDFSYLWLLLREQIWDILPSGVLYTVAYILTLISNLFYGVTLPYLAITVSSVLVKKLKLLLAVGIGYGMSLVLGIIPSILSAIEGAICGMIMVNAETFNYIPGAISLLITAAMYMAFAIGGYFLMHRLVKNKLNL